MASYDEIVSRWESRRLEGERTHSLAPVATIAALVLADLHELEQGAAGETLDREEAARCMGVHPDSVTRMLRKGQIRNVGTKSRPRFLRAELPRKGAHPKRAGGRPLAVVTDGSTSSAEAIARDALASRLGRPHSA